MNEDAAVQATVIASLEGIKIEVFEDRAVRYLMDWKHDCWRNEKTLPLEWNTSLSRSHPFLGGINDFDKSEVMIAIHSRACSAPSQN